MAGNKKYEMSFELNGEIDPRLTRTFDTLSKDVTGLEKDLGQLRRAKGFDRLTKDAGEAGGAFHELREDVREFGQVFERTLQFTGAYAIIEKITGSIGEMISTIGELDAQSGQLAAATGATAGELEGLQDISKTLYLDGLGEGINDLTDALVIARNVTKQQGDELANTARNAIVLQDVFQFDIPESVKASDTMMRQFGITSEQSMNLLAQGAQRGLDKSGELLDSANEYAPQFAALGYSANEMFDIFATGLEAGAWNLDKVGDLAKEFNIRIQDGSDKTADALAALFAPEGIEDFTTALTKGGAKSVQYFELLKHVSADTAKEMVKNLQKGGKRAEDTFKALSGMLGDGDKILSDLSTGAIKGKDVMQRVITELSTIEDNLYRNTLGVELFGTQWEDLEKEVVSALGSTQSQFDMTKTTMEEMAAVKYDNLTHDLKVLGRELMDEVIIPIGEELIPTLKDMTAWAKDNKDVIKAIGLGVPAALLAKNTVGIAKDFGKVGKAVFDTTEGVSKFGRLAGLLTNPVGIAVGAVGALSLGVIAYKNHQENARQELINMGDALKEVSNDYEESYNKAKKTNDLVWTYNNLSEAIKKSTGNSELLKIQQDKLADVTEELQRLHPETITQYDIENGKLGEKVDLLLQASKAEQDMMKLKLEQQVAEGRGEKDDLGKQITSLEAQTTKLQEQKDALDIAQAAFKDYEAQYARLMEQDYSEERTRQIQELLDKANEVGSTVGKSFGHLDLIQGASADANNKLIDTLEELNTKTRELSTAKDSYQSIYDAQLKLIEIDLGMPIEEAISKYGTFDEKVRKSIDAAKEKVRELNQETRELEVPVEKMVTIGVQFKQYGDMLAPRPGMQAMQMYAEGGYADRPSIFGEAGPEMAIPLRKDQRSKDLHALTGRLLGVDSASSGENTTIHFNPTITVTSGGDVSSQVMSSLRMSLKEFENLFQQMQRQRHRVSLSR